MILDLALFGAGFVLLLSGAEMLVRAAAAAAAALRMPALLAGVLDGGVRPSPPELAVRVDAAFVAAPLAIAMLSSGSPAASPVGSIFD